MRSGNKTPLEILRLLEDWRMRKSFVFVGCVIAIFSFFCTLSRAQETKKPKLVIEKPIFDAGEINEGETIKHTFLIYNHGNATLEIKDVRPG